MNRVPNKAIIWEEVQGYTLELNLESMKKMYSLLSIKSMKKMYPLPCVSCLLIVIIRSSVL